MLIDTKSAVYVLAVAAAVGGLRPEVLTDQCPECGTILGRLEHDYHLVVPMPDADPKGREVAVIIGCEGYWVVNPALVGIDAPNWGSFAPLREDDPPPPGAGACARCLIWEALPDVHKKCPQCGRPWDAIVPAGDEPDDGVQTCSKCHDSVHSVSTRGWCDGCEEESDRS